MDWRATFALPGLLAAAACADIPRDPDETLERVRAERAFRVGIVAPGADLPDLGKQMLLIAHVADRTGARAVIATGASERLLTQLEQGELELVIGELGRDSPWRKRVTMLPSLEKQTNEPGRTQLTAAARNGENAWISLLYREAQAIRGGGS